MKIKEHTSHALLIALLAAGSVCLYMPSKRVEAKDAVLLSDLPAQLGKWKAQDVQLSDDVLATLGAQDYLLREYKCGETVFTLYLTYFNTGSGALTHNPEKCYTAAGWTFLDKKTVSIPNVNQSALESTLARGDTREIVVYWYQDRTRVLVSKGRHILGVVSAALFGKPMHSLVASVSTPVGVSNPDVVEEELRVFSGLVMEAVVKKLPL